MAATCLDLTIRRGETFSWVIRWASATMLYKAVSAVVALAPLRLTVTGHGIPDGWPVALSDFGGMVEVNAKHEPPRSNEYVAATYVNSSTIELNSINATAFSAYTSGGVVRYHTPISLTGYVGRLKIKNRIGGTEQLSMTIANGRVTLDEAENTITLSIDATDTEDITWDRGVYDMEMEDADGVVTTLYVGSVTVVGEVTTTT